MIVSIGCDRTGYNLKVAMAEKLCEAGYELIDHGQFHPDDDLHFPDLARQVCQSILDGEAQRGIMFCGTSVGATIACNKIPGIRASTVHDVQCAHQSVEHDHVQVMTIGEKCIGEWLAWDLIQAFLQAEPHTDDRARLLMTKLFAMDDTPINF
ncbi:MAG: RpiB/LacA/LacB family sugar-phosphate isomerase [Christensenellales bacterium]